MEGFNKLKDTLLASAKAEAEVISASANAKVAAIVSDNVAEIAKLQAALDAEKKAFQEAENKRESALTSLELRRQKLELRQSLLAKVMKGALEALVALPTEKKSKIYQSLLSEHAEKDMTIFCNARDIKLVEEITKATGLGLTCKSSAALQAGLIFQAHNYSEDCSFETILKQNRAEYTRLAATILFKKQEEQ